jgi:hypothetical protein
MLIAMKIQTLLSIGLTLLSFSLSAQINSSLFKAGATIGLNRTQIDGDEQFGYNRSGLSFGLRGAVVIKPYLDISTELLFSQRGALPDDTEKSLRKRTVYIDLQYAEVPLLLNLYASKNEHGFYRWNIYGGVSYGRLLRSKTEVFKGATADSAQLNLVNENGYKSYDLSLVAGIGRYFTPRLGVSIRHTASMTYLYKNPAPIRTRTGTINTDYKFFRSFFISVNAFYNLVSPKIKKPRVRSEAKPKTVS